MTLAPRKWHVPTALYALPALLALPNTRSAPLSLVQVLALYVKLGALFLKQVSKPLASALKQQAVVHPTLSRFLTRVGQRMHESNARITAALKTEGEIANSGRKARGGEGPLRGKSKSAHM